MTPSSNRLFRFLSSIQLAAPLILILAVLLATGTIVESHYSTLVAKRFVYGTWWFALFLLLLGTNVLCSALSRYPWKKHQTGFVITHLGILLVLCGSLVTQHWGKDGQIALKEGERGSLFQEDKPTLYVQKGKDWILKKPAGFNFYSPSPDRPWRLRLPDGVFFSVDRFYLNAQKEIEARPAHPGEKGTQAVQLDLSGSFVSQDQWLFLGDADDSEMDLGPASVFFEKASGWGKKSSSLNIGNNALVLLAGTGGELQYRLKSHGQWGPLQNLEPGQRVPTGWMDLQFAVLNDFPSAVPEAQYLQEPLASQKDPTPVIHYQMTVGSEDREGWLGYQDQDSFVSGGVTFFLAYGPKKEDLPFSLQLVKFNLGLDPGTRQAASYASDVLYGGPTASDPLSTTISMNRPLHEKGYTVYQSSYQALPDGKYLSVFAVGRDPGLWIKYAGALCFVLGIVFMFWFKNPAWKRESDV